MWGRLENPPEPYFHFLVKELELTECLLKHFRDIRETLDVRGLRESLRLFYEKAALDNEFDKVCAPLMRQA